MEKKHTRERSSQKKNHSHHWVYVNIPLTNFVPELVMLGHAHYRHAVPLTEHHHSGSFEFVFVEKGKVSWKIEDTTYETRAGDIFHTKPDEVHLGNFNIIEPCQIWWLILKSPNPQGWLRLTPEEITVLQQKLQVLPRIVPTGILIASQFKKLLEAIEGMDPFRTITTQNSLLDVLFAILRPKNSSTIADDLQMQLQRLIEHMELHPEWRPTIEQLAVHISVSPSHFYRTFQEYTGLTPMSYMERIRIEAACRLLKESDISITKLAYDLGYQTSQHFATVFKRFIGATPSSWRE